MKAWHRVSIAMAIVAAVSAGGTSVSGIAWADRGGDCSGERSVRCACGEREGGWSGHRQRGRKIAKALGLSGEQRQEIKAIFRKHRDEIAPLRGKMVSERRELRNLIRSDKTDEAAIREQTKKIAATSGDLAVLRAGISREVRAVLTPEQVKKFRAMQEKRDRRIERRINREEERHSNGE